MKSHEREKGCWNSEFSGISSNNSLGLQAVTSHLKQWFPLFLWLTQFIKTSQHTQNKIMISPQIQHRKPGMKHLRHNLPEDVRQKKPETNEKSSKKSFPHPTRVKDHFQVCPFRCFYNCLHPTEPHILLVLRQLDPEVVAVSAGCSLALFSFPVLERDCPLGTAKSTSSIRIIWSHEEAAPMNSFSFLLIHPDFTMMMLSVTGLHVVPLASHSFLSSWLCRAKFGASQLRWHVGWNCPL